MFYVSLNLTDSLQLSNLAEFRDTAPLILTRKFYFTITLPQKIKKKQAPSLNCIMNTAATSKQLAVMKLTILTVMSPRIEGPQPVSQNILPCP